MRTYRLTNEPGGLGLSCTAAGLSFAGTPLLRRTEAGVAPRPAAEIASLMKAAVGADGDATRLESSLQAIARAVPSCVARWSIRAKGHKPLCCCPVFAILFREGGRLWRAAMDENADTYVIEISP